MRQGGIEPPQSCLFCRSVKKNIHATYNAVVLFDSLNQLILSSGILLLILIY